jgi:hypothetical protein
MEKFWQKKILYLTLLIIIGFLGFFFFQKILKTETSSQIELEEIKEGDREKKEKIFNPALLDWKEATPNAPWSKRDAHASLVFQDKIWIFGGLGGSENFDGNYARLPHKSDVWVSENGKNWQLIKENAPWGERGSPGMVVFKDKIWLLGGWEKQKSDHKNDVWVSENGMDWKRVLFFAPWQARSGHQ